MLIKRVIWLLKSFIFIKYKNNYEQNNSNVPTINHNNIEISEVSPPINVSSMALLTK